MNVEDFTGDAAELLAMAFRSPKLHPKKTPNIEIAMRVVGDAVSKTAKAKLTDEINIDLMDAIAMYEINNGEYVEFVDAPTPARDDYESGMDDVVEASLEDWNEYLSADWLGKNTIDTGVWESTDMDRSIVMKLATNAAKEVFKQLTADKTPAQVLSSAGIVKADVEATLAQQSTGETDMTDNAEGIEGVIAKLATYLGKDFDTMAVYEDMETLVEESDDILVSSAASRLGANVEDTEALQIAALGLDNPAAELVEMLENFKAPSARSKKRATKAKKDAVSAEETANAVDPVVMVNLKACGAGDTAMAEELGVSRSTYTNYIKGKTPFSPDGDQYTTMRTEVIERTNLMLAALSALDGIEHPEVV